MKLKVKPLTTVLSVIVLLVIFTGCQSPTKETSINDKEEISENKELEWADEILEVKATIDQFLIDAGNYDLEAMEKATYPGANVGVVRLNEDNREISSFTFAEYFERTRKRELSPYYEPAMTYAVEISEGLLAFVRAECILHKFGVPRSHQGDFFTLMKVEGKWKIINGTFTSKFIPEEEKEFDLDIFARSYAQSWGSNRPDFVAMYFAEDGSLRVNDAEASVGREKIAALAQGFMTDLPDMVVRYDSLVKEPESIRFHWTLIATYSGPNGNGNKVNVSGYEEWQIENERIKKSQGHFPTEEYNKQIGFE